MTTSFNANILMLMLWSIIIPMVAVAQTHPNLPHQLSPDEQRNMPAYKQAIQTQRLLQQPPNSPVRTPAEWEETQGLIVTWTGYQQILREIVRYARLECTVYIITNNSTTVQNYLTAGDVPLDNIVFLNHPYNSIWIRDYGPWSVYTNDVDSLNIVDWIYNRPRPLDNAVPEHIANDLSLPFYEMTQTPYDLVHTGGNYMVDGLGTAFSSELILDENPSLSEEDIDSRMAQYMGIDRYIKMETLPYDEIHHIDMHLKLLDEETLLAGQYPSGIADGPQIEENLAYIVNNFKTPFGNPYQVVRVQMPPDSGGDYPDSGGDYRTYANAIFINKTILVPTYTEQYDTTNLQIIREQLPGYNVVGINCNSIVTALGALHCITKLVHSADPLLIAHPRLRDTELLSDRTVIARIQHRSGIESANLYYTNSLSDPPTPYSVPMNLIDPDKHLWTATIPAQATGSVVQYYIEATANSGKTQVRPITAPEGMYSYRVLASATIPLSALLHVQLTGAFDSSTQTMRADLRNNQLLPQYQPYSSNPWNYNGDEFAYGIASQAVDWVLVELRDAANASNIISRKAALLYQDGTLHQADGSLGVSFGNALSAGNYYVAIKHRNHLPIMSAAPIALPNATAYNFTASPTSVQGTNQLQAISPTIWALCPADINRNGVVSVSDFNTYLSQNNSSTGTAGYWYADLDLNGVINSHDFELYVQFASRLALPILR